MKFVIDGEVLNNSVAKSMMTETAYDIVNEYELHVVIDRADGVYIVTIYEPIDEHNLEPLVEWDEFEDDYPVEYAISDVLHDLMSKIWERDENEI